MSDEGPPAEPRSSLIGLRTAIFLYAVLVIVSCLALRGKPLYLALIVVGGLAAKSYVHYLRERVDR